MQMQQIPILEATRPAVKEERTYERTRSEKQQFGDIFKRAIQQDRKPVCCEQGRSDADNAKRLNIQPTKPNEQQELSTEVTKPEDVLSALRNELEETKTETTDNPQLAALVNEMLNVLNNVPTNISAAASATETAPAAVGEQQEAQSKFAVLAEMLTELQKMAMPQQMQSKAENIPAFREMLKTLKAQLAMLQTGQPQTQQASNNAMTMQQAGSQEPVNQELVSVKPLVTSETPNATDTKLTAKSAEPENNVINIMPQKVMPSRMHAVKPLSVVAFNLQNKQVEVSTQPVIEDTAVGEGNLNIITANTSLATANVKQAIQPQQTAVLQKPDPAAVMQQIVQRAQLIKLPDYSEIKVQLKPEHLGELTLRVTAENGLIAAKFYAENHQVKEIIQSSLPQLKQSLADQGIKIDQCSVYVGSQDFGDAAQQFKERGQWFAQQNTLKVVNEETSDFDEVYADSPITSQLSLSGYDYIA